MTEAWIGSGIRFNAIAPGLIATPMTAGTEDFIMSLGDIYPIPIARAGQAAEVGASSRTCWSERPPSSAAP